MDVVLYYCFGDKHCGFLCGNADRPDASAPGKKKGPSQPRVSPLPQQTGAGAIPLRLLCVYYIEEIQKSKAMILAPVQPVRATNQLNAFMHYL